MRKFQAVTLVASLGLIVAIAPTEQVNAKVTKPSAPTIVSVTSATPKKGLVNVTVKIRLPNKNGGSKITGSKVSAGGKFCTINGTKTSCQIKNIKLGTSITVKASSKNKSGFGASSNPVRLKAGKSWPSKPTPVPSQTTPVINSCAVGGPCAVGDIGPGGGIVFYVDNGGFGCGPNQSSICKNLEVAPPGWHPTAESDGMVWYAYTANYGPYKDTQLDLLSHSQIGRGYLNSGTPGMDSGGALASARAYEGGGLRDWYLPAVMELNLLCQWAKGVPQSETTFCTGGSNPSAGLSEENSYWSSTQKGNGSVWLQSFSANPYNGTNSPNTRAYVRPIRSF